MKRVFLLIVTNFAILAVLSVTMQLLGIDRALTNETGLNLQGLLVFAAMFGFGGAFISLFISKWMAKRTMGVQLIEQPRNADEQWLVNTVIELSQKAGIKTPEIGVFAAQESNAFATGWNRNSALVAVSTGLMNNMTQDEAEAVLGHEISHVANGDMVTLDCETQTLTLEVSADELAARPDAPRPLDAAWGSGQGLFGLFRRHAALAEEGASPLIGRRGPAHQPRSTHSCRCGRSAAMVVLTPWPGITTVCAGSVNSLVSIEWMIDSKLPPSKPVAPGPPGNSVSPLTRRPSTRCAMR